MASEALEREIAAYEQMLPRIRAEHGLVWALVVDQRLQGAFEDFHQAAQAAVNRFPDVQVLIRHTSGHQPSLPFMLVEAD